MNSSVLHAYGDEFSTDSASEILPYIFGLIGKPDNVIDIGCGTGTWLKVCKDLGVSQVRGYDGPHVLDTNQLLISKAEFTPLNLENLSTHENPEKYDLAICLEVVEHLSPFSAEKIVNYLCQISNVILFSAAMPGQTGENHLNEQYPDYWHKLFRDNGFTFYDLRGKYWNNEKVEWWYRQNIYLVSKEEERQLLLDKWNGQVYIIKEMHEQYVNLLNARNAVNLKSLIMERYQRLPVHIQLKLVMQSIKKHASKCLF